MTDDNNLKELLKNLVSDKLEPQSLLLASTIFAARGTADPTDQQNLLELRNTCYDNLRNTINGCSQYKKFNVMPSQSDLERWMRNIQTVVIELKKADWDKIFPSEAWKGAANEALTEIMAFQDRIHEAALTMKRQEIGR